MRPYRSARHVGRVRQKLADVLIDAFEKIGKTVRVDPSRLRPATGYWRTDHRADVYRWEGIVEYRMDDGRWLDLSVDSWDPMSCCVRGLTLERDGHSYLAHAGTPRVHPGARK